MTASTVSLRCDWECCEDCGTGERVPGYDRCLAHLDAEARDSYLSTLRPGADLSHRGTTFTEELLNTLTDALRDTHQQRIVIGKAFFVGARFSGDARFAEAQFTGDAWFNEAQFTGDAWFNKAQFSGDARFVEAQFTGVARFRGAQFSGDARFRGAPVTSSAWFHGAQFIGDARFDDARFCSNAGFDRAQFIDGAGFGDAWFGGDAEFYYARFGGDARFVKAQFSRIAGFSKARFGSDTWFDKAQFGSDTWFGKAQFSGIAVFDDARFGGIARFDDARFGGNAWFGDARFGGYARFDDARFGGDARFGKAQFDGNAGFDKAQFSGIAWFGDASFSDIARFDKAQFAGNARFDRVTIDGSAEFREVQFSKGGRWGPLVCRNHATLHQARFAAPITLEIEAGFLDCTRTIWSDTATLRVRHAVVDLTDAVLTSPVVVTAHPTPFTASTDEADLSHPNADADVSPVRIVSVRGVDTAHLTLTNVALDECLFTGAFHLDQLSLGGQITFAQPLVGWHFHGPLPVRWSRRQTLAEEHHWRQHLLTHSWPVPALPTSTPAQSPVLIPQPDELASTYRALRQALESRGNAPGAADFYYGEMEMRRHDPTATRAERGLLTAYWLLSGYGLRASRALTALLLIMASTVLAIMLIGLPATAPEPVTSGTAQPSGRIILHTTTPAPALPSWGQRISSDRLAATVPVVLDAVVFRAADSNLTPTGVYLDMFARLAEPSLLALAVLAIRGRLKR